MRNFSAAKLNRIRALESHVLRPGANVVGYVRSTGQTTAIDNEMTWGYGGASSGVGSGVNTSTGFYTSLADAFADCTAGKDNVIFVLPGHSESVGTTLMDNCIAGTTVIGLGDADQDNAPTLLFSGATSNLAIDTKNVTFANLRLMADADNVTEAITLTAAGFKLVDCYVDAGVGSSTDILIFLNISTGANNALVAGNTMRCTAGGNTTLIKMATVVDNLQVLDSRFFGTSQSTTLGNLSLTAALTNVLIAGNLVDQQKSAGTAALNISDVAATGFVCDNYLGTLADSTAGTEGILLAGSTNLLIQFFNNYNSDGVKSKSGILSPAVTGD